MGRFPSSSCSDPECIAPVRWKTHCGPVTTHGRSGSKACSMPTNQAGPNRDGLDSRRATLPAGQETARCRPMRCRRIPLFRTSRSGGSAPIRLSLRHQAFRRRSPRACTRGRCRGGHERRCAGVGADDHGERADTQRLVGEVLEVHESKRGNHGAPSSATRMTSLLSADERSRRRNALARAAKSSSAPGRDVRGISRCSASADRPAASARRSSAPTAFRLIFRIVNCAIDLPAGISSSLPSSLQLPRGQLDSSTTSSPETRAAARCR